jgi:Rod binding domain-containing protein
MKTGAIQGIGKETDMDQQKRRLKEACEEFEAVLTTYLLKAMRQTVDKTSLNGQDTAQDLYEGMLDESLAKELSHQSGLGLGEMLYRQLVSHYESKHS